MTPQEINKDIADRIAFYMPKIVYFRGLNYFSDNGKMYLISEKSGLTEKFRTSYLIMLEVLTLEPARQ